PPTPTLLPYTTLFRSLHHVGKVERDCGIIQSAQLVGHALQGRQSRVRLPSGRERHRTNQGFKQGELLPFTYGCRFIQKPAQRRRSEEHTSELQSQSNL